MLPFFSVITFFANKYLSQFYWSFNYKLYENLSLNMYYIIYYNIFFNVCTVNLIIANIN